MSVTICHHDTMAAQDGELRAVTDRLRAGTGSLKDLDYVNRRVEKAGGCEVLGISAADLGVWRQRYMQTLPGNG